MNENLTNQIVAALLKDGTVKMTGEEIATAIAPAVAALPKEYRFMGVATPDLTPGKIFVPTLYVAVADGWYTGFSKNQMNEGQIVFFTSDDGRVWAQTTAHDPAPQPEPPAPDPMLSQPLTFEATEDSTTVKFAFFDGNISDAKTIEISTDDGMTWTEKTASEEGTLLATLNSGDKVMLRGNNLAYSASGDFYHCFDVSAPVYVYGNIMSMIDAENFAALDTIESEAAFLDFLSALDSPWLLSKEDANLMLPATTLSESCYYALFGGQALLERAPVLPAKNVPAGAYDSMFNYCETLNHVECLAEEIADRATYGWLEEVAASGTFIKADNMDDWTEGANGIPSGWTVRNESDPTPTPSTGLKVIVSTADWSSITDEGVSASSIAGLAELIGMSEDDLSGIFEAIRQGGVLPIILRNDPGSGSTWYYLPKDSYNNGFNFDARWEPVGGQPSEIEIAYDGDVFSAYSYTE